MKLLIPAAMALIAAADEPTTLTIERLFDSPSLDGPSLRAVKVAPDGSRVSFLREKASDAERLDLWAFDLASGEQRMLVDSSALVSGPEQLSEEEKARRERQRIAGLSGIVSYEWSPDASKLLFPLAGRLYVYDLGKSLATAIDTGEAPVTDPKVSPKGRYVGFVSEQDLWAYDLLGARLLRLTEDGGGPVKNGMAEFVAQEEMDRDTGYWFSPDDSEVAFIRVDESPVAITQRYEIYADEFRVIDQRYPYAGTPNVRVRLGVYNFASNQTRWLDLGEETDIYIARVDWLAPGALAVQRQSRDQRTLDLLRFETVSGKATRLLRETSDTFVNLHHDLRPLKNGFLWSSERSGFRHLYLYDAQGKLVRALTAGDWAVDEVEGIDEAAGLVYFTAALPDPTQRQLYRQAFQPTDPKRPERISQRKGFHDITMAPNARLYVDQYSSQTQPPQVSVHAPDGERLAWLVENRVDEDHPYAPYRAAHRPVEFGTLRAEDGQTLHYRITRPLGFTEGERYPAMIHVYGGPHVQMVNDQWSRRILFEQYMAQQGYVVFALDNRGSARRGTRFENALHRRMGTVEVADQLVGARHLASLDFIDPERIGVFGWSYGGYMTLLMMFQHPEVFAAGVSVAPVTDWALYDTHYTERYMGTPADNARGYELGSVFPYTRGFDKPLLVIHGMADDNVLYTHSTKLFEHLQRQGVLFDSVSYPGAKHGISGQAAQTHVYRTIARYFEQHLKR